MTIPLAFESASAVASSLGRTPSSHSARATAVNVRARIRRELGDVSQDVLWRMTTKPWARARRSVARLPRLYVRDVVEGALTAVTMVGMAFVTLACLIA